MTPEQVREATVEHADTFKYAYWATDEEASILMGFIRAVHMTDVFEIGTANGFTATCMALAGATVHTFDVANRPKIYDLSKFKKLKINFKAVGSPECFEHMILPSTNTMFFIDGDHSQTAAIRDFNDAYKIARSGDIILLHDVLSERRVFKAWCKIRDKHSNAEIIKTHNGLGVVRK